MLSQPLHQIKKELGELGSPELTGIILRLARFKKDNKELLHYLLFESNDESAYINRIKKEVSDQFAELNTTNIYFIKKGVRKILRSLNRYIKYSGQPITAVELLIHFCTLLKEMESHLKSSTALHNIYDAQIKKTYQTLKPLHEDLQYDYSRQLHELGNTLHT